MIQGDPTTPLTKQSTVDFWCGTNYDQPKVGLPDNVSSRPTIPKELMFSQDAIPWIQLASTYGTSFNPQSRKSWLRYVNNGPNINYDLHSSTISGGLRSSEDNDTAGRRSVGSLVLPITQNDMISYQSHQLSNPGLNMDNKVSFNVPLYRKSIPALIQPSSPISNQQKIIGSIPLIQSSSPMSNQTSSLTHPLTQTVPGSITKYGLTFSPQENLHRSKSLVSSLIQTPTLPGVPPLSGITYSNISYQQPQQSTTFSDIKKDENVISDRFNFQSRLSRTSLNIDNRVPPSQVIINNNRLESSRTSLIIDNRTQPRLSINSQHSYQSQGQIKRISQGYNSQGQIIGRLSASSQGR